MAANWTGNTLPASGDDVVIGVIPGNPTIQFTGDSATVQLHSLITSAPIDVSGGTLQIATTFQTSQAVTLSGGTIQGATITATGTGAFSVPANGTGGLDGVTLASDFTVYNNGILNVANGLTLNHTRLILTCDVSYWVQEVFFVGTQTLGGTGEVVFSGLSRFNHFLVEGDSSTVLTIGPGITVHGTADGYMYPSVSQGVSIINQGTITADSGSTIHIVVGLTNQGTVSAPVGTVNSTGPFSSSGTMSASGTGTLSLGGAWSSSGTISSSGTGTLNLGADANGWSNTGTITATTGTVNLGGVFTLEDLGAFSATGGTVNLTGTMDVTGGTLALTATSGSWNLMGGTIKGGTITATGGASLSLAPDNSGVFDGVTLDTDFTLSSDSTLYVRNGLTLGSARLILSGAVNGYSQTIYFQGTQTLAGTGEVVFGGSSSFNNLYALGDGSLAGAAVLTIGAGITVHGSMGGTVGGYFQYDSVLNQGIISADTAGQMITIFNGFTNQGTVSAPAGTVILNGAWSSSGTISQSGAGTLDLGGDSNAWSNTGTITATAGTVNLGGVFTLASLGTFNRTGSTVNLTGTMDLAGGTLALTAATGSWNLMGGTIKGGTITAAGGAGLLFPVNGTGTLDGVTLGSDLTLIRGAALFVKNGLTLASARLILSSDLNGSAQSLVFLGSQMLGGTGEVVFGGSSGNNFLVARGDSTPEGAAVLTIGAGITVHGTQSGNVQGAYSYDLVINQGIISADTAGQMITIGIGSDHFINQGTVSAPLGTLNLTSASWTSSAGTLAVSASGVLNLGGTFAYNDMGVLKRTGGTLSITGILDNTGSTLALTAATGSWNLVGGTIKGGSITAAGGAVLLLPASTTGTLDGVTLETDFTVSPNSSLVVKNGLTLAHARLVFNGAQAGDQQFVLFQGTQTLGGTGEVVFGGLSSLNYLYAQGDNTAPGAAVLTIGAGITVHGSQGGYVQGLYSYDSVINQGIITADTVGQTITIINGFTNLGTVSAPAGTVSLSGATLNSPLTVKPVTGALLTSGSGVLDFGSLPLGKSKAIILTLHNPGMVEVSSIAVTMDGANAADYTLTGPAVTKLAPKASATFTLTYHPTATGVSTAAFHIASKQTGALQPFVSFDVALTGAGGAAPAILTQPQPVMVALGTQAQISVVLDSSVAMAVPLTYQWQKNNATVVGATAATYTIPAATLLNAGTYKCTIKNSAGTLISATTELGVVDTSTKNTIVAAGTTTTLTLSSAGNGQTFAWQNGGTLPTGATGATTKTLTLKNLAIGDAGTYSCVVSGPGGPVTGGNTTLKVFDGAPVITPRPVVMPDAYVSGSYAFQIPVDSTPNLIPTSYSATGLPAGLTCNTVSGAITGKPTTSAGSPYTVVLKAINSKGGANLPATTSLIVHPLPATALGTFNALVDRDTTLSAPIATPAGQTLQGHGGSLENMTVTNTGAFTATLKLDDKSYLMPAGTALDAQGTGNPTATVIIKRGTGIANLTMSLTINISTGELTGTLTDGIVGTPVNIEGWRNPWKTTVSTGSPANPATTLAGTYTAALEMADSLLAGYLAYPQGNGYATVTVSTAGAVTWTGVLADGTTATRNTTLGPNGEIPLHWMLYTPTVAATAGSAHGWVRVGAGTNTTKPDDNLLDTMLDLTSQPMFDWMKKPQLSSSTTRTYKAGIPLHKLKVIGGGYVKPAASTVVLGFPNPPSNAKLTFSGAQVEDSVTYLNASNGGPTASMDGKVFTLSTSNVATMPSLPTAAVGNPASLVLTLKTDTGAMSGTFTLTGDPDPTDHVGPVATLTRSKVAFSGVLVQRLSMGVGCFLLPQLPSDGPPKTTLLTSPLLSGQVLLQAGP